MLFSLQKKRRWQKEKESELEGSIRRHTRWKVEENESEVANKIVITTTFIKGELTSPTAIFLESYISQIFTMDLT